MLRLCTAIAAAASTALTFFPSPAAAEGINGRIALEIGGVPNTSIISIAADGTGKVTLAKASTMSGSPSWSPGGRQIVFVSQRDANAEIYVMNADGTAQTRLTFFESSDTYPSFSPDGTNIMFSRFTGTDNEIFLMDADGSDQHQIADLVGHHPAWAPDGTKIAYAYLGEIWVADANGANPVQLTDDESFDGFPRWSPDGTDVLYRATNDVIMTVPADGNADPEQYTFLGGHPTSVPVFSPDGQAMININSGTAYVGYLDGTSKQLTSNMHVAAAAWQPVWTAFSSVSDSEITFGDRITLNAHLHWGDTTDNDLVSLYRHTRDGDVLVGSTTVDSGGDAIFTVAPSRNTVYVLKWEGALGKPPSTSNGALILVHVDVRTRVSGYYGTAGRFRLYHLGHGIRQKVTVAPNHARKHVAFEAERRSARGDWVFAAATNFALRADSTFVAIFSVGQPGKYRVRNRFRGDADHLGGRSDWVYIKVTA